MAQLSEVKVHDSNFYYETRYTPVPERRSIWKHIANYLNPFIGFGENDTVLDLGSGYGSWIRAIPAKNRHALDVNPDLSKIFEREGIQDVKTHVGSCTDLKNFENQSVDVILASNLLEHLTLSQGQTCLAEALRVLKKGGRLCLIQPNFALCPKKYFDDYTHQTIYTDISLRNLLEASGFRISKTWRKFLPFSMSDGGAKLHFLVPLYLRSPFKPMAGQMAFIATRP